MLCTFLFRLEPRESQVRPSVPIERVAFQGTGDRLLQGNG